MVIVRYADDIVVGFEREADGRRFLDMMRERLEAVADRGSDRTVSSRRLECNPRLFQLDTCNARW